MNEKLKILAQRRLPDIIGLLRRNKLTGRVVKEGIAPNRMTVSRWAHGQQKATDEQLAALADFCARHLNVKVGASDKEWASRLASQTSLRDLRGRAGLTQRDVATAIGVSRQTYLQAEQTDVGAVAEQARKYLQTQIPSA